MDLLANRPNVLFSTFVRNEKVELVYLTKMRRDAYYRRLITALTIVTRVHGTEVWKVKGRTHRENGPAATDANGVQYWYKHGKIHRDERINGIQQPASHCISADKSVEYTSWYLNSLLGRADGIDAPAYIKHDILTGDKELRWYKDDKLHRETGPANIVMVGTDIKEMWFLYGDYVNINLLQDEIDLTDAKIEKLTNRKECLKQILKMKNENKN